MITAKGTESDKVKGFEYGADDYVNKSLSALWNLFQELKQSFAGAVRKPVLI